MKILCAGNRFVRPDGAALWLFDEAVRQPWPAQCEWIEAGLGGLNLLPHFETGEPVWLLDYLPGRPNATCYSLQEIDPRPPKRYQHDTALRYLLHALPELYDQPPPVTLMSCNPRQPGWMAACLSVIRERSGSDG